jgi:hypothetical protein
LHFLNFAKKNRVFFGKNCQVEKTTPAPLATPFPGPMAGGSSIFVEKRASNCAEKEDNV